MKAQITNQFSGPLNSDVDPAFVKSTSPIDALNLIFGVSGAKGARIAPKGNAKVNLTLPPGINKVIGAKEDKQTARVYYFLQNSLGNHLILCYRSDENDIITVAAGSQLGFRDDQLITGVDIIDGRYLAWVDGRIFDGAIQGGTPKMIDVVRAITAGKQLTYEFYPDINNSSAFESGNTYQFDVVDSITGSNIATTTLTADGSNEGDFPAALSWVKAELESALGDHLTVEECSGCSLDITMSSEDTWLRFTRLVEDTILVPINHYPNPIEAHHVALAKYCPPCEPTVKFVNDPSTPINNVARRNFQFRVRYIHEDGCPSAWGPVSVLALNLGINGEPVDSLNAIRIRFTDGRLIDPSWVCLIKQIEIAVRDGNDSFWKRIKTIDRCEFGIVVNEIVWKNDDVYQVIESDDSSQGQSTTQVLKLFDEVPLQATALTSASGTASDHRLFLADGVSGYDCPDCIDVSFDVEAAANDELVDITGTVQIINNPAHPSANPEYAHYLGGFVVFLAGTPYYAISDNPADGSGTGAFTIKNVPRGRYIIRVASYQCRFNNDFGTRYNLNNGLEWQRTSSPMIQVAGSLSQPGAVPYERIIDLRGFLGATFNLGTQPGFGPIQIANAHATSASLSLGEIYVMDGGGGTTNADFQAAIAVERLMVKFTNGASVTDIFTDHNGYVWYMLNSGDTDVEVATPGMVSKSYVTGGPDVDKGWKVIFDGATGTGVSGTLLWNHNVGVGANFLFLFNNQTTWTADFRRVITGQVVGSDGSGIQGVLVMYQRNDRPATTDFQGNYSITVYPENDGAPPDQIRDDDQLFPTYLNDSAGQFVPSPVFITPDIDPWGNYAAADFVFPFSGGLASGQRYLKNGGKYKFGLVYEDQYNRTCGVVPADVVNIPFFTQPGEPTKWRVKFNIGHQPPEWAVKYRLVRSTNLVALRYFQWMTDEIKFGKITNPNLAPVFGAYSAGDWTHLFIRVNVRDIAEDADALLLFFNEMQEGYTPQVGDRVRFIYDESINPIKPDGILEVDVSGKYVDGDDTYVVVPRINLPNQPKAGWMFEFYTPKGVDDVFYYESGDCYEIIAPGTAGRRHGAPVNQVLGSTPAMGYLNGGDTYWRVREFNTIGAGQQIQVENRTISKFHTTSAEDIGRAFVEAPRGQTWYKTRVWFSGLYRPNSKINGLCSFGALDYLDLNQTFGPISWIGYTGNNLLALHHFKVQPLYLGKGRVLDLRGQESIGRADSVAGLANESISDYGCAHPESVVVNDGQVFWWDWYRGVPVRYTQAGVNEISFGKYEAFQSIAASRRLVERNRDIIPASFDRLLGLYVLTFSDTEYLDAESNRVPLAGDTYAFSPDLAQAGEGGWVTRFSFRPEMYASVGPQLLSFKFGELWRHNVNNSRCLFYDNPYRPKIKYAVNGDPTTIKIWFSMTLRTDRAWQALSVSTPRNTNYNSGMLSRIRTSYFRRYEGDLRAEFLRDMNSTDATFLAISDIPTRQATALLQGQLLRSHVAIIEAEYADTLGADVSIWHAMTEYLNSSVTGAQ